MIQEKIGSDNRPQARAPDIAFKLRDADLGSLIGLILGRPRWSAACRFASLQRSEPMADDGRPLRRYPIPLISIRKSS
jgi:hypothetical protein